MCVCVCVWGREGIVRLTVRITELTQIITNRDYNTETVPHTINLLENLYPYWCVCVSVCVCVIAECKRKQRRELCILRPYIKGWRGLVIVL